MSECVERMSVNITIMIKLKNGHFILLEALLKVVN